MSGYAGGTKKTIRSLHLPSALREAGLRSALRNRGLPLAVPAIRLCFGIRRAIGWSQASRRQRWTVTLGAICALSILTGGVLAAARVGQPGPLVPPQTVAANQALAAAWIVQQVSPGVPISCDRAMCRQLRASGFPAAPLKTLPRTDRGRLGSGLVVSTPDVRNQFGTSLDTAYAPLVIAGFGSGAERVDVRVVAPEGAAAFKSQLAAEHASRVSAGKQLLRDQNIHASPAARAILLAGGADSRLMATLSVLAAETPVQLVLFKDAPPGATPGVPLRGAEIGARSPADLSTVLAFLRVQQGTYRPAAVEVVSGASGQPAVTIRFDASGVLDAGAS